MTSSQIATQALPWLVRATDWRAKARCRIEGDPEWWYPPAKYSQESLDHPDAEAAAAICALCPVRQDCLESALEHDLKHGIFAGTTPRQRQLMAARRRRAKLRQEVAHAGR